MKKILSLLLVVVMIMSMLVACGKNDAPAETTPKPTDKTQTEVEKDDESDTEEEVLKFGYSAIDEKRCVMTTYSYNGFPNLEEFEAAYDKAYNAHDLDELSKLIEKVGQTVVSIPCTDEYGYDFDDEGCIFFNDEGDYAAEIAILPGDLYGFIEEDEMTLVEEKDVNGLTGAYYKVDVGEEEPIDAYVGKTEHGALVVIGAYDATLMNELLDAMEIYETTFGEAIKCDDEYEKSVETKKVIVSVSPDYQSFITYKNDFEHTIEDYDGSLVLINDKNEEVCELYVEEAWFTIDELDYFMQNLNKDNIYFAETENMIGYMFVEDAETYFYGIDKNSGLGLMVEGFLSLDDLYKVVSNTDITLRTFEEDDVESEISIQASLDESNIGMLSNDIMLSMADMDIYDLLNGYAVENYACYASDKTAGSEEDDRIITKQFENGDHYIVDDSWREANGEYNPVGKMRGVTITFNPVEDEEGNYVYILKDAVINQFVGGVDTIGKEGNELLLQALTNNDDILKVHSDMYHGAPFTVFVAIYEDSSCRVMAQFGGRYMLPAEQ